MRLFLNYLSSHFALFSLCFPLFDFSLSNFCFLLFNFHLSSLPFNSYFSLFNLHFSLSLFSFLLFSLTSFQFLHLFFILHAQYCTFQFQLFFYTFLFAFSSLFFPLFSIPMSLNFFLFFVILYFFTYLYITFHFPPATFSLIVCFSLSALNLSLFINGAKSYPLFSLHFHLFIFSIFCPLSTSHSAFFTNRLPLSTLYFSYYFLFSISSF